MSKKLSKTETKKQVQDFFSDIRSKSPEQVKKIKKLAMGHNISLREFKKKFCKKCLTPYMNPKIRIRNKVKSVTCKNCSYVARWKIK